MSTTWPNGDQKSGVSTTMRPVTHTAEVEVKKASSGETRRPGAADSGQAQQDAADDDQADNVQRQHLSGGELAFAHDR